MDAEIGLKIVEHLLGVFTAARLRLVQASRRCEECGSYSIGGSVCEHCGWEDPDYQPPQLPEISEKERAQRPGTTWPISLAAPGPTGPPHTRSQNASPPVPSADGRPGQGRLRY
jgi:hypothetical protein